MFYFSLGVSIAMIDRECKYDEQCHQHTNNTVCVQVSKTIYFP